MWTSAVFCTIGQGTMMDWVLSLVVLSAVALLAGAFVLWRRGNRRQATLMIVLAIVMFANVALWTVPDSTGTALIEQDLVTGSQGSPTR